MLTLKWNIGIFIIRIGYFIIRIGYQIRKRVWFVGEAILKLGYSIRGDIPMKTWKKNHI